MRRVPADKQHVAFAKIDPGDADIAAGACGFRDGDGIAVDDRVFLDHDGIGAIGNHAAGEDARGLARTDRAIERPARRDLADHLQPCLRPRSVGGAHRIAVHRRHRLRRLRAPGGDIARQHAMMRGLQRHHLLRHRLAAFKDRGKGVGNGHQRHGRLLEP